MANTKRNIDRWSSFDKPKSIVTESRNSGTPLMELNANNKSNKDE